MALLAFNLTTSALPLAAGSPVPTLPASSGAGIRGPAVDVTSELRGLSGANYTALEAQRSSGDVDYLWTDYVAYATGSLSASTKTDPTDAAVTAIDYSGASSFQNVAADLTLAAGAGKNLPDTSHLAPIMGNLFGDALTKTGNYLAGVIGKLSVTGVAAAKMALGGIAGVIADGVTDAHAAVQAVLDGDSAVTRVRAMFGVRSNNSVPGSGADFGLDLKGEAHDGFSALAYSKAAARLDRDVVVITGAGAPVDGTTGDDVAGPGSLYIDITGGDAYLQTSLISTPVWKLVTRAA